MYCNTGAHHITCALSFTIVQFVCCSCSARTKLSGISTRILSIALSKLLLALRALPSQPYPQWELYCDFSRVTNRASWQVRRNDCGRPSCVMICAYILPGSCTIPTSVPQNHQSKTTPQLNRHHTAQSAHPSCAFMAHRFSFLPQVLQQHLLPTQ
jgi:hypothetical protein